MKQASEKSIQVLKDCNILILRNKIVRIGALIILFLWFASNIHKLSSIIASVFKKLVETFVILWK
jgi:hypothetical protein